jgi:hypothetical protein
MKVSREEAASDNKVFTHRGTSPLGPLEAKHIRLRHFRFREVDSADTSAPPNRIAAVPFGHLRWWDVVNTETLSETADKTIIQKNKNNQFFIFNTTILEWYSLNHEICYWCGKKATLMEHVPPKCLFPEEKDVMDILNKSFRNNLITVPSCVNIILISQTSMNT